MNTATNNPKYRDLKPVSTWYRTMNSNNLSMTVVTKTKNGGLKKVGCGANTNKHRTPSFGLSAKTNGITAA